jgi:hypothetical protein
VKTSPVLPTLQSLPKRESLRILICGELGSGRSSFATSFPNAVPIDAMGTLFARDDRPDVPILRTSNPDEIETFIAAIKDGLLAPDTIVIDGLPAIVEHIEQASAHIKGYDSWLAVRDRLAALMKCLLSVKCNLVMTTRVKQEYARPGQVSTAG